MEDLGELEIEDISVASTVPTDLSVSEISDIKLDIRNRGGIKSKKQIKREQEKVSRQLLEKKQLEHDMQVLKIELNQKEYLLDNFKTEYQQKIEDLEEKLNECRYQKKIIQAKSDNELHIQQDEARRKQDVLQATIASIQKRQKNLEHVNEQLTERAADMKKQLREHEDIDESKYYELRGTAEDQLSVKNLVAMKIFETVRPFKVELDELKNRCTRLQSCVDETEKTADAWKKELDEERREHASAQVKLASLQTQNQGLQIRASTKDYRLDNYERIMNERDDFEKQLNELKEKHMVLESEHATVSRDKKHFEQEYLSTKSSLTLVTQDKDYLSRQVCELTNKLAYADERLQRQNAELDAIKKAREELFEKYVHSRDLYKSQYEQQLQTEMRQMSSQTQNEVEKLRATTKAMYEMENRNLRETRDLALAERERAVAAEAALNTKYHEQHEMLLHERANSETKISQLTSEMKLAEFERQRYQLLQEETSKNLKDCQLENEKMMKKLEVMNREYFNLEMKFTKELKDRESQIREYQTRMQAYENIEKELDEVILQAAEVDDAGEGERVMLSYGYGATLPSSSQRRMKQSVHLARRCLQLERKSVGDKKEIDDLRYQLKELKAELNTAQQQLDSAQQPYSYIISKTQELETKVKQLEKINFGLEADLKAANKQLRRLHADKKQLAMDLESTSRQFDEIQMMKESIKGHLSNRELRQSHPKNKPSPIRAYQDYLAKAKHLIMQGSDASLREAQDCLKLAGARENVASRVIDDSMAIDEAVQYLDTMILASKDDLGSMRQIRSPVKLSMSRGKSAQSPHVINQPPAITIEKRSMLKTKRPAMGVRKKLTS